MAYDIRMVKLVTGEVVIGKYEAAENVLNDVAAVQTLPTQQSVQMILLPYGYPFEQEFGATLRMEHVLYSYRKCPEEISTKYLEACSNLTLSGLGGLDLGGSGLIK